MPPKIRIRWALACFFSFYSTCYSQTINSNESVREFVSHIVVNADASIDVTENITVYANQDKIRHGIARWLPMNYLDSSGVIHKTLYQIRSILINNQPAPYVIKPSKQALTIVIGQRNTVIDPGLYTFTLRYHVNDAITFLKNADGLNWNITGSSWDFPIDKVIATLTLPQGTQILQQGGHTGKVRTQSNDYSVAYPAPNQISFATTKALVRGEELTIAITWPKGIIQQPQGIVSMKPATIESTLLSIAFDIVLTLICIYLFIRYLLIRKQTRDGVKIQFKRMNDEI